MTYLTTFPFKRVEFDPDDNNPDYIGLCFTDASDSGTALPIWRIIKVTKTGGGTAVYRYQSKDNVAWTDRATVTFP